MVTPAPFAGRYQLVRALGAGGQGDVYEAFDINERDTVAIKLFKPTLALSWVEAIVLRALTGHHILPIHNADVYLGQPYLVTALARNGSVDHRIAPGIGLELDIALSWARQACMGAARGHTAGIVHNDIKPGNLFINDKGESVLADFGYAGVIDRTTGKAACNGATAETTAPEVAAAWGPGNTAASVASDVYSLGATAFNMLSGTWPIDLSGAAGPAARMAAAAAAPRTRLRDAAPHVPKAICDAVDKALSTSPSDRFEKAEDFYAALGRRQRTARRWERTNEHPGHLGCFRGHPTGTGTELLTCAEPGTGRKVEIHTNYQPSGRTVTTGCRHSSRSQWTSHVRRIIANNS